MTGSRHARRAALPTAGYTRERQLDPDALTVTVPGESGGTEAVFDFSVLPGPRPLLTACAAGFARLAGPDQPWRAADTCTSGYKAIREFLRHAAVLDPPPAAPEDVTPAVWAGWRLSRPATVHGRTCLLITRQWLPKVPGIPAATAAAAARRIPAAPAPAEAAYTREEFEQIRAAAAGTFRTALTRIRASREHLRRWHDGEFPRPGLREQYRQTRRATADYLTGEALDTLLRTGDVPLNEGGDRGVVTRHARALGGVGPLHTWGRLFLTMPEAAALTVLLVCDQGWNRSVLDAMTVPDDMPGAGEDGLDIYRVPVFKRRRPPRTRYASANLIDTGPDTSGRLIRQVIEATEPARITLAALGEPSARLLVSRRATPAGKTMFCLGVPPGDSLRRWASSAGLADDGGPGQVSLRRLRRTVQVLIRRKHGPEHGPDPRAGLRAPRPRRPARSRAGHRARAHRRRRPRAGGHADADAAGRRGRPAHRLRRRPAAGPGAGRRHAGYRDRGVPGLHPRPVQPAGPAVHRLVPGLPGLPQRGRHPPAPAPPDLAAPRPGRAARNPACGGVGAGRRTHFLRLTALLEDNTTPAERDAAARAVSDADRELIGQLLTGRYTA